MSLNTLTFIIFKILGNRLYHQHLSCPAFPYSTVCTPKWDSRWTFHISDMASLLIVHNIICLEFPAINRILRWYFELNIKPLLMNGFFEDSSEQLTLVFTIFINFGIRLYHDPYIRILSVSIRTFQNECTVLNYIFKDILSLVVTLEY